LHAIRKGETTRNPKGTLPSSSYKKREVALGGTRIWTRARRPAAEFKVFPGPFCFRDHIRYHAVCRNVAHLKFSRMQPAPAQSDAAHQCALPSDAPPDCKSEIVLQHCHSTAALSPSYCKVSPSACVATCAQRLCDSVAMRHACHTA
jgi:hypothetical protein